MYLALCALLPLIGGGLSALIRFKSDRARNIYIFCVTALTSAGVLLCVACDPGGRFAVFSLSERFVCAFSSDGLSRLFSALIALLWPFAALYAFEYMESEWRTSNFFVFFTMAYGVALLLANADNLFTLYIFFECLTVVTLPLVEHEQSKEAYRAGRTYLMYLIGGTSLGFAAMVIVQNAAGANAAFRHGGMLLSASETALRIAFTLGFLGFGVKATVFPLCRWLPKASVAPTPVTALLHAVAVVNAGVFSVCRCAYYVFPAEIIRGSWAGQAATVLSSLTVLYGAVRALRESHIKRRLAWSTVSNLGYMLFALSLLSSEGMTAALVHMLFHSLMKIVLFFCAGAVMIKTGREDLHETRGLSKAMPFTFAAFTLAGAALTGVPPLCGFTSKYLIVTAALKNAGWTQILGAVCLIASAVLTAFYIFTIVVPAYFSKADGRAMAKADMGLRMKISVGCVCVFIVLASVFSDRLCTLVQALQEGL